MIVLLAIELEIKHIIKAWVKVQEDLVVKGCSKWPNLKEQPILDFSLLAEDVKMCVWGKAQTHRKFKFKD